MRNDMSITILTNCEDTDAPRHMHVSAYKAQPSCLIYLTLCVGQKGFRFRYCSIYKYKGGEKEEECDFGSGWNDIPKKVNHAYRKRPLLLAVVSDGNLTFKPDALRTEYVFSHTYPISEISNMLFLEYVFSHTILYLIVALDVR